MIEPAEIFEPAEIVYERHATAPRLHGRAFSSDEDGDGPAPAVAVYDTALCPKYSIDNDKTNAKKQFHAFGEAPNHLGIIPAPRPLNCVNSKGTIGLSSHLYTYIMRRL